MDLELRFEVYRPTPINPCNTLTFWHWIRLAIEIIILILTVCGNLLVVVSIAVVKGLRQRPKNYFILSLAVADLLVGLLVLPFKILLTESCKGWSFGVMICYAWVAVDIMCCTSSILSLTVISLDRYVAISHPLTYRVNCSSRNAFIAIAVTWVLSFGLTCPHLLFGSFHHEVSSNTTAGLSDMNACMNEQNTWQMLIGSTVVFFLPLFVMVFVYGKIARIIGLQKSKFRPKSESNDAVPKTTHCTTAQSQFEQCRTPVLALRIAEAFQEKKGCITMGIVIAVFVCCWFPFFSLLLVVAICQLLEVEFLPPNWIYNVFLWLAYSNSCLNPFIYTMFSKDFRYAFKEILCLRGGTLNSRIRRDMYSKQMGNSSMTTHSPSSSRKNTSKLEESDEGVKMHDSMPN